MKIGLISDTHGHLDDKVYHYFEECDEIWHAGDVGTLELYDKLNDFKPVRGVYGNIDGQDIRMVCPEDNWFECEELTIWMTHIGGYPPKYNRRVKKILMERQPDIFICGHSHILKIMRDADNDLLHINPGAAGLQGFHRVKTLVRFEILGKEIKDLQVIELGPKAQKKS